MIYLLGYLLLLNSAVVKTMYLNITDALQVRFFSSFCSLEQNIGTERTLSLILCIFNKLLSRLCGCQLYLQYRWSHFHTKHSYLKFMKSNMTMKFILDLKYEPRDFKMYSVRSSWNQNLQALHFQSVLPSSIYCVK